MKKLTMEELEKMDCIFITAKEAAAAMGISANTFYRRAKNMDFPVNRVGRKIIVPREPFLAYLRAERREQNARTEK